MSTGNDADFVGPAEVLAARFQNRAEADAVRAKIEAMGYDPAEVSYMTDPVRCSSTFTEPGSHWQKMVLGGVTIGGVGSGALGAAVGAATGGLAVLGPIGLVAGAVIGGAVSMLISFGVADDTAVACAKAIDDGALVMVVQTHAGDNARVRAALGSHVIGGDTDEFTAGTPTP